MQKKLLNCFEKPVRDVKRMLGLNERITSVDTPIGGTDKSLLDTVADETVNNPSELFGTVI